MTASAATTGLGLLAGCSGSAEQTNSARTTNHQGDTKRALATTGTEWILLGNTGGPRVNNTSSSPAHLLVVDGRPYVVDCGYGVAKQLVAAGMDLGDLRNIFITHQHADHNVDYGTLLLLAWAGGLKSSVDAYGPPPLEEMTDLAFQYNAYDIRLRSESTGRPPLEPLVHPHEISEPGVVMEDDRVKVTAKLVEHPPVEPAFGYRFDNVDRSIAFSGDTNANGGVAELAEGADVLVHEALYSPAVDEFVARSENASTLRKHLFDSHTTVEDAGKVAAEARVKTLVLTHFVPGDPELKPNDEVLREAAAKHFDGDIVVGRDLLRV